MSPCAIAECRKIGEPPPSGYLRRQGRRISINCHEGVVQQRDRLRLPVSTARAQSLSKFTLHTASVIGENLARGPGQSVVQSRTPTSETV
jgi:hypothetical protein